MQEDSVGKIATISNPLSRRELREEKTGGHR
jgi:hypothetical protein